MKVSVYFVSHDSAFAKRYFKLPFEWSALPATRTKTAVPVKSNRGDFILEGVVIDVSESYARTLFQTETPPEVMREIILPGELQFSEVYSWLD